MKKRKKTTTTHTYIIHTNITLRKSSWYPRLHFVHHYGQWFMFICYDKKMGLPPPPQFLWNNQCVYIYYIVHVLCLPEIFHYNSIMIPLQCQFHDNKKVYVYARTLKCFHIFNENFCLCHCFLSVHMKNFIANLCSVLKKVVFYFTIFTSRVLVGLFLASLFRRNFVCVCMCDVCAILYSIYVAAATAAPGFFFGVLLLSSSVFFPLSLLFF